MNRSVVALHEATHAAVALHLGLAVREVRVEGELAVPRYCEQLYGIAEGTIIPGTGCLLEDDCLDEHLEETLVAMVAPSCIETGDTAMDFYAVLETGLALDFGSERGVDTDRILERAHQAVLDCEEQILALAARLEREGVVEAPA